MRGSPAPLSTLLRRLCLAAGSLAIVLTASTAPAQAAVGLGVSLVQNGFSDPVLVTNAGDSRLFVVEQTGRIEIVGGGTFLDISDKIACCGERGLLGLAFHPDYADNGLFYVYYARAGDGAAVVAEYHRSNNDPNVADPTSARIVLSFAEPYTNHNGGWLGFKGPNLYISTGDGGSGGDPQNHAQDIHSYLGKILRINPLDPDGNGPRSFSVPHSNPYVGRSGLNVIWARGLRNPWRCSFDSATGKLWCGDVGQNAYEEIDRVKTRGTYNFGWRLLEGRHYYNYPGRTRGRLCRRGCRTAVRSPSTRTPPSAAPTAPSPVATSTAAWARRSTATTSSATTARATSGSCPPTSRRTARCLHPTRRATPSAPSVKGPTAGSTWSTTAVVRSTS